MPADLHTHSTFSDGTDSPEELVRLAAAAGLTTIALTDHDNVDGIEQAAEAGRGVGVEVIPGIEFTTENSRAELHILGYFIDYRSEPLLAVLQKVQHGRVKRIDKIVQKLNKLGVDIEPSDVFSISGEKAPGRPHVARALIKRGAVGSFKEAFDRYLDWRAPAYVPHYKLAPIEAIKLIKEAGGIPVFAHPAISNCDDLVPKLVEAGLRGLEVYYPGYYRDMIDHYLALAKKHDLLVTGGTDFHGEGSGREIKLGDLTVPDELVDKLKNEHLRGN
ncbi:MAG: PHP domain-containing protein [Candidatus Margulisbacteria bacterium]|nr:PHP domain-containing protein [Candidatus Margulisiibacteriota bacterium]